MTPLVLAETVWVLRSGYRFERSQMRRVPIPCPLDGQWYTRALGELHSHLGLHDRAQRLRGVGY